uniref:Toxin co-regulated pilus biosynthesis protein Q C-terminal domain-containing protein n=1 Tax=mine drainage metagenome TaxID=410659 RepID=E6QMU6_9ZZZZ
MRRLFTASAIAIAASLAGCASQKPWVAPTPYTFWNGLGAASSVVSQVFDDGATTYIMVRPGVPISQAVVVDASGRTHVMQLAQDGAYLTFAGVYSQVRLDSMGHWYAVVNPLPKPAPGQIKSLVQTSAASAPKVVTNGTPVAVATPISQAPLMPVVKPSASSPSEQQVEVHETAQTAQLQTGVAVHLAPAAYAQWNQAVAAGGPVPLDDAVLRIAPKDGSRNVAIDGLDGNMPVAWTAGTRLHALRDVIGAAHAYAVISANGLTIKPLHDAAILPVKAQAPTPKPVMVDYTLHAGDPIEDQLRGWAKQAGWTLIWDAPQDWVVPGNATFGHDFQAAAKSVLEALSKNGADIRGDLYPANHTLVVHAAGQHE